ncbi:MAG: hypothetical protein SP4CHLAM5_06810 [Chlamydiia bacterium]|nr:hypothetical protein [Chlamydiia bacterium]
MHTRCKNIYLRALLVCLSLSPLSISGVCVEPNALEHTPSSFQIPKVSLKSLPHQYSLFTSYLKDFDKESLIHAKELSWDIFIPQISKVENTTSGKNNFLSEKILPLRLGAKGEILHIENIVKILPIFFEGNSSENIAGKSNNEEIDNYHRDSPSKAAKNIQAFLECSEEFKKSSHGHGDSFDIILAKDRTPMEHQKVLVEKKVLLKPVSTKHEFLTTIDNKEILEQKGFLERILTPDTERQESLFPLSIPEVSAFFHAKHPYSPYLEMDTTLLVASTDHISQKKAMKKVLTPIQDSNAGALFLKRHFDSGNSIGGFLPVLAKKKYRSPLLNITQLTWGGICLHKLSDLNITKEEQKHLQRLEPSTNKYIFIENTQDMLLPRTLFNISTLKEERSLIDARNEIACVQDSTIKSPSIPISSTFLKNMQGTYNFRGHMKNTPLMSFLSDVTLTYEPDSTSLMLKTPIDITSKMDVVYTQIDLPQIFENKNQQIHTAENETFIPKDSISLDLPREKNYKTVKGPLGSYLLSDDKNIGYKEIHFSKLVKAKPNEPDLFLTSTLPHFLKKLHKSIFINTYPSSSSEYKKKFLVFTENSTANYAQIVNKKVETEIAFGSYKIPRSLDVPIKEKGYEQEITKHAAVISEEKNMQPLNSSIGLPAVHAFAEGKELPVSTDLLANKKPIPLNRVCLEKHINITKANYQQNISLPETIKGREKASFAMHPLLSLFESDIFDIGKEAQNNATITNRSTRMTGYSLFNWPTLEQLETDSFPDGFTIQTRLLSSAEGEDVDFVCTIRADEKDLIDRLPTHILYVLDTSKSIEAHRFNLFKKAIVKSLEQLDRKTTFNIAVLNGGKIKKLREKGVVPTKSAISYAKRFLKKIDQSPKISFDHLITLLEKEKRLALKGKAARSCVLLTDGNFAGSLRVESGCLKRLIAINAGNFSIYTASISDKNNKSMLSLLSKLNHGFSLFTRTHASFPRKFSLMLKHIKQPVMHDIVVTFPDDDDETKAYVNNTISPILLTGRNLTIFGTTPTKKSRRVFIQGRSGNKWINILKELPLGASRRGKHALQKKLANQKTLFSLQSFLDTNDEKYLSDAKKYSEEYDLHTLVP